MFCNAVDDNENATMGSGEHDWQVVRLEPAAAGVLELFKDSLREAGSLPITSLQCRCARAL